MRIRSYKAGSFVMEKSGDQWKDIGCPRTEGNDIKSLHIFLMILLRHIFSTIYVKSKFSFFFTIFLQLIDKICRQQIASQSYIFNIYALLYYLYYFFVLFSGMYYLTLLKTNIFFWRIKGTCLYFVTCKAIFLKVPNRKSNKGFQLSTAYTNRCHFSKRDYAGLQTPEFIKIHTHNTYYTLEKVLLPK